MVDTTDVNIPALLARLNWNQGRLAGYMHRSEPTISNWIHGRHQPDAKSRSMLLDLWNNPPPSRPFKGVKSVDIITASSCTNVTITGDDNRSVSVRAPLGSGVRIAADGTVEILPGVA